MEVSQKCVGVSNRDKDKKKGREVWAEINCKIFFYNTGVIYHVCVCVQTHFYKGFFKQNVINQDILLQEGVCIKNWI